jgi:hypothetical protein
MTRCRPFKLVDAMILVAATATWMAMMRPVWEQFRMAWSNVRKAPTWESYIGIVEMGFNYSLSMLTVAYLVMRLIPPRPLGSDLIRKPQVPGTPYLILDRAIPTR